jgi:hypothetical protein
MGRLADCLSLLAFTGVVTACAHDARLEAPQTDGSAQLITLPADARIPARAELLEADVELFGLPLGHLASALCPGEDSTTIETHVEPAALVKVLHRSGGDARTEFAALSPSPRVSDYHIQDGDLLRHYRVDHKDGAFDYLYDNGGEAQRTGHGRVPEGAFPHDLQSSLLLLRAWHPRLREVGYFYVVLGRRLWRTQVTAAGPEVLKTASVPRLTQRLDGVSVRLWQPSEVEPRHFSIWLSEDPDRLPLRMVADASVGQVTLSLTGRHLDHVDCSSGGLKQTPPAGSAPSR